LVHVIFADFAASLAANSGTRDRAQLRVRLARPKPAQTWGLQNVPPEPTNNEISVGAAFGSAIACQIVAGIEKPNLNRLVGRAETTHECTHHVEREKRRFPDEEQELLLADGYHAHVCFGDHGGAARPIVDQRHLAEDAFLCDGLEHPVAASNLNLAAVDDEHLAATITFLNDSLSGLERSQFCAGIRKQAEIDGVRHVRLP
jgi:hypothetical protein